MRIRKDHTYTTDVYHVEDGPVEETAAGYLSQGRFRVNFLSVTYQDGVLSKVYLKGKHIRSDGLYGKTTRARTYFSEYPEWVTDYLGTVDL